MSSKGKGSAAQSAASYDANGQYYTGYDHNAGGDYYYNDPSYYSQQLATAANPATRALAESSVTPSEFVPVSSTPPKPQPSVRNAPAKHQVGRASKTGHSKSAGSSSSDKKIKKNVKNPSHVRTAAGQVWEDEMLNEWEDNDFRLFAGDLGPEVTDETLRKAFEKYPSLIKTRVVRDKRADKSKGYGFISFGDAGDFVRAWKDMNGKYVGNRPIKLKKSNWKEREMYVKKTKVQNRQTPY